MKMLRTLLMGALFFGLVGLVTVSCEKEGPAEKAGKKVDETLESAKKALKKMTDK